MQLIAVDIGNSSVKIAAVSDERDRCLVVEAILQQDGTIVSDLSNIEASPEPALWSISSVNRQLLQRLVDWIAKYRPHDSLRVLSAADMGLRINVEFPEKVGVDRLTAACHAIHLNNGGPVVVIDSGTAVTVDLVDDQSVFQGGIIFPGTQASLAALAANTDALPDLTKVNGIAGSSSFLNEAGFLGKSTETAILLGVYQSQIQTLKSAVATHNSNFHPGTVAVYITGGGVQEISNWLPASWHRIPDLVLQGARMLGREFINQSAER